MKCRRCGSEIYEGEMYCPNCGEKNIGYDNINASEPYYNNANTGDGYGNRMNNSYYANNNNYYGNNMNTPGYYGNNMNNNRNNRNNKTPIIILLGVLLGLVILTLVVYFTYSYMDSHKDSSIVSNPNLQVSSSISTEKPTEAPVITPQPDTVNEYSVPKQESLYTTYNNSAYRFSCKYPSSFVNVKNNIDDTYILMSEDGSAEIDIGAHPSTGRSMAVERDVYGSHSGNIEYNAVKKDYFAFRVNDGYECYYMYLKRKNNIDYWFSVRYPSSQHNIYDKYVNDIYQSFNIY